MAYNVCVCVSVLFCCWLLRLSLLGPLRFAFRNFFGGKRGGGGEEVMCSMLEHISWCFWRSPRLKK